MFFAKCWFDADRCAPGLEALTQYRKRWNERLKQFEGTPEHDWASHGADAFRYPAVRHKPPKPTKRDEDEDWVRDRGRRPGLSWMA